MESNTNPLTDHLTYPLARQLLAKYITHTLTLWWRRITALIFGPQYVYIVSIYDPGRQPSPTTTNKTSFPPPNPLSPSIYRYHTLHDKQTFHNRLHATIPSITKFTTSSSGSTTATTNKLIIHHHPAYTPPRGEFRNFALFHDEWAAREALEQILQLERFAGRPVLNVGGMEVLKREGTPVVELGEGDLGVAMWTSTSGMAGGMGSAVGGLAGLVLEGDRVVKEEDGGMGDAVTVLITRMCVRASAGA